MARSNRPVPFFNYPALYEPYAAELDSIFQDVCRRGAYIHQRDLLEFEERLAAYVGAKYVLGIANATDALHLAFRAVGLNPGDEVVFCTHTMVATAAAVHYAGGTPVPCDCGADHLMDPESAEAAITSRTRAILPTQLNGRTANMDAIRKIAAKYDLMILEDAAQALGSKYRGQCAGTFGKAACVSFYPAKTLGCLGDGGCVITNDDEVYERLCLLRDHGRDAKGEVQMWGLNSRLDNLQAAVLNFRLNSYDDSIMRRREIAGIYHRELSNLDSVVLPPAPSSDPDHFDIFQNFEIEADDRDQLRAHLSERGIGTLIQWGGKAVHQFTGLGFSQKLPRTESLFTRLLMLPMNTSLTDEDVEYVCNNVREYYAQRSSRYAA